VDAGANAQPVVSGSGTDHRRTAQRSHRTVERGEQPVASRFYLSASEAIEG
jgi:hypothetical protein